MSVTNKPGKRKKTKANINLTVSHTRKPGNMSVEDWQATLRRQVAASGNFSIKNIGNQPVYSDYSVVSTGSNNTYKVALRSADNSRNFCTCLDFKTNGFGTCKHIESVRMFIARKRGIKKFLNDIPEPAYSSIYLAYNDQQKIKIRIGTNQKRKFALWAKKYFNNNGELLASAYPVIENLLREAKKISSDFRFYPDALDQVIGTRQYLTRSALIEKNGKRLLKNLVKMPLFPYQQEGVLFALRAGRSILADDMGLGKTIQAIAWAVLMRKQFMLEKAIVVCPTSLKYQWKTEIEKFSGEKVTVVEGSQLQRKVIYKEDESYIKIISYHVAGNDWELINNFAPDIIILDEAQRIKNWRAKISANIKRLKSTYSLTLTGTPLQNNIEELYSLVQFTDPLKLGSLHNFLSGHQETDDSGKVIGYTHLHEIGRRLSGLMLRRTKKEVLTQLPKRQDKNLLVPVTEEQMSLHDHHRDIVAKLVHKWRRMGFLQEKDRQRLLNSLNMMRMVCDSTYILDQETNFQTKLDELFNILEEIFEMKGEKVVIFSQWERMTRLVAMGLQDRKVKFESLHGGVPSQQREALFTNFNEDPECRVFLSTDAGGVGLNLQAAAYMINLDIPWNPAVLEQRIARIYRMGQKKNVSIINLVAKNTIEEKMLEVLKFKSSVAAGVLDNGEDSIFLGDSKFNKLMETVEAISVPSDNMARSYFDENEKSEIAAPEIASIGSEAEAIDSVIEGIDSVIEGIDSATEGIDSATEGINSATEVVNSEKGVIDSEMKGITAKTGFVASEKEDLVYDTDIMDLNHPGLGGLVEQASYIGGNVAKQGDVARTNGQQIEAGPENDMSTVSLAKTGMDFFAQLVNTLKQPDGVKNICRSITEKDETGKTYLKLPVDSEETIEKAINMLAGFLKNLK